MREAYDANIPNPAFRTLVCAGWNHDHDQLVLTACNRTTLPWNRTSSGTFSSHSSRV